MSKKTGIVKDFFNYNPVTGEITWSECVDPSWYKVLGRWENFMYEKAGNPVEFSTIRGKHLQVCIIGFRVQAHIIAWVSYYGMFPENQLDHIDGNPQNNAIGNLREVTNTINCRNRSKGVNNTSGYTGVYWRKREGKYQSQIKVDGKYKSLGYYETAEEANIVREKYLNENMHLGFTERHGR